MYSVCPRIHLKCTQPYSYCIMCTRNLLECTHLYLISVLKCSKKCARFVFELYSNIFTRACLKVWWMPYTKLNWSLLCPSSALSLSLALSVFFPLFRHPSTCRCCTCSYNLSNRVAGVCLCRWNINMLARPSRRCVRLLFYLILFDSPCNVCSVRYDHTSISTPYYSRVSPQLRSILCGLKGHILLHMPLYDTCMCVKKSFCPMFGRNTFCSLHSGDHTI